MFGSGGSSSGGNIFGTVRLPQTSCSIPFLGASAPSGGGLFGSTTSSSSTATTTSGGLFGAAPSANTGVFGEL